MNEYTAAEVIGHLADAIRSITESMANSSSGHNWRTPLADVRESIDVAAVALDELMKGE